ncbi:MAG: major facilitator superfamily 1 [Rhizorhabdus sp.]|nr:major facilitator superfamily 1 [Rhizorhabdus sp.]
MAQQMSPFSYPAYRHYWLARLSSTIAQNSMIVVIGWQVYDIARRTMPPGEAALQLGIVGLLQFLPLLVLTLISGWVADRLDRRWIVRTTAALEVLCAATLAILAWQGTTTLHAMFAVATLLGVARAFAGPAMQALSPNLVPREILPSAIAMSAIAWQVGAVFGPPIGGYLYAIHAYVPFATSAALFGITCVMFLTIGPVPRIALDKARRPWRQMIDGLAYMRQNRLVLGAISLDLFAVLLGGATAMLPIYARDILHVGASGLGHLRAAPALGSAAVAIWFARRPLRNDVGLKLLLAVALFGAATVVFGFSRWLPLSLACLAILGAADMVSVFVRQTLIQLYTPDDMRGRVGAVSTLFISGSNELGEAESGFLAAAIGPVAAVVAGGIGTIAVAILWAKLFPVILRARTFAVPEPTHNVPAQEKAA